LITAILAQWWLGERLSMAQWFGSILLSLNLILVGFEKPTPNIKRKSGWLACLQPPELRW